MILMDRVIEILRRLVLVTLWFVSGSASLMIVIICLTSDATEIGQGLLTAIGVLVAAFIFHRVLNWVVVKDDKNAPTENQ